jgi:hypothetical protein
VGRDPQRGCEGLERGAQHTFPQIQIKTPKLIRKITKNKNTYRKTFDEYRL